MFKSILLVASGAAAAVLADSPRVALKERALNLLHGFGPVRIQDDPVLAELQSRGANVGALRDQGPAAAAAALKEIQSASKGGKS